MRNNMPLQKPTTPLPTLALLAEAPKEVEPVDSFELEQKARLVEASLADYRVKAEVVDILPGPVTTCFELDLAPGSRPRVFPTYRVIWLVHCQPRRCAWLK